MTKELENDCQMKLRIEKLSLELLVLKEKVK